VRSTIQNIKGILQNVPHIVKLNTYDSDGKTKIQKMLVYKPMSDDLFKAFSAEYFDAPNNDSRWEVFKEYMVAMEYKVVPQSDNKKQSEINLIVGNFSPNTSKRRANIRRKSLGEIIENSSSKKKNNVRESRIGPDYTSLRPDIMLTYDQFVETYKGKKNKASAKLYQEYKRDWQYYSDRALKMTPAKLAKKTTEELMNMSKAAMRKSFIASGIFTNIINTELAHRLAVEQAKLTGVNKIDNASDINLLFKFLGSDNVSEDNPHLQSLYRIYEQENKKWEESAGDAIEKINKVTNDLINDRFKGFSWLTKFIAKLIGGKKFHEFLYKNLMVVENKKKKGITYKEIRLINRTEESSRNLTKAEKAFVDMYRKNIVKYSKLAESAAKVKAKDEGFVLHVHADSLEAFQTRGLAGLYMTMMPQSEKAKAVEITAYDPFTGKQETKPFGYFQNVYLAGDSKVKNVLKIAKLRVRAEILAAKNQNQDGSPIRLSNMEVETLLGTNHFAKVDDNIRFDARLTPSLDLNESLTTYVRSTIFKYGDQGIGGDFAGMESLMPIIDGIIQIKKGADAKNTAELVNKLFRLRKMNNQNQQTILGAIGDGILNHLNKITIFAGIGFNTTAAIGNIVAGKYAMIRNNGGKSFALGEARYWGFMGDDPEKGFVKNFIKRQEFLKKLGLIDETFYYDYSLSKQNSFWRVMQNLALSPMTISENWIQGVNVLGLLTEEEYESIQKDGSHNIDETRLNQLLYDVRRTHGRGYTPTTERMISLYSLGRSFQLFKKYMFTNFNERFGKEMTNLYGEKEIGSMRVYGHLARDLMNGKMSITEFKEYYDKQPKHKKEAIIRGLNGMGMITFMGLMMAVLADDDDEPDSYIKSQTRRYVRRGYNDVAKYYDVNTGRVVMTPYPYYTIKNMTKGMTETLSLASQNDITLK